MRTFTRMGSFLHTSLLSAALVVGGAAGVVGIACIKSESMVPAAKAGQQARRTVIDLQKGSDDARAVAMALDLATSMLDKGAEVTIYANLEGVRMFDRRQPDLRCGVDGDSIQQRIERFVAGGGRILVCPLCAEAAGLTPDNLRPGAKLADMDQVADMMLAADVVIDY